MSGRKGYETKLVLGVLLIFCFTGWLFQGTRVGAAEQRREAGGREVTVLLAGDAIITQTWSHRKEAEFMQLVEAIRGADAAIVNLEMMIHDYKGYAQADSGGTYMSARPVIAKELAWAGFDMCGNANNHTFDWGSIGVLETVENVTKANIVIAGAGKDLQTARAPAYYDSGKGKVALVSCSSSFTAYGKASRSRPDIHGRPGLNPLTMTSETQSTITAATAQKLQKFAQQENISGVSLRGNRLRFLGTNYTIGERDGSARSSRLDQKDVEGNLASIRQGQKEAALVVLSLHAHSQGAVINEFCHRAIDAGADAVYLHGPHEVRGIEIYRGKPIMYSLGDFVFQNEQIEKLPVEFYDTYGLGDNAKPVDAQNARSRNGTRGFPAQRGPWEGVLARLTYEGETIKEIELLPVDMGFGKPVPIRGFPLYADAELGKKIIGDIQRQSKQYGVEVEYVEGENVGKVVIK